MHRINLRVFCFMTQQRYNTGRCCPRLGLKTTPAQARKEVTKAISSKWDSKRTSIRIFHQETARCELVSRVTASRIALIRKNLYSSRIFKERRTAKWMRFFRGLGVNLRPSPYLFLSSTRPVPSSRGPSQLSPLQGNHFHLRSQTTTPPTKTSFRSFSLSLVSNKLFPALGPLAANTRDVRLFFFLANSSHDASEMRMEAAPPSGRYASQFSTQHTVVERSRRHNTPDRTCFFPLSVRGRVITSSSAADTQRAQRDREGTGRNGSNAHTNTRVLVRWSRWPGVIFRLCTQVSNNNNRG